MIKVNNNKYTSGFSLIELMIVIAIIGILAAIAIPAYGDYVIRAKVSEAVVAAGPIKNQVAEYRTVDGTNFPTTNALAGLSTSTSYASTYVASITIGTGGSITVLTTGTGASSAPSIILTPTFTSGNGVTWACTSTGDTEYVPANCR